ncbi:hypothetical protein [Spirosoma flavum]|uniref:Uncharacterized protein n=1 Tax=Spirosoma flavum TaxID=2048557 RepID=A0ABW6AQZ2_9BACT
MSQKVASYKSRNTVQLPPYGGQRGAVLKRASGNSIRYAQTVLPPALRGVYV